MTQNDPVAAATAPVPRYDPRAIEPKWQARWEADRLYEAPDDDPRPSYYFLTMLPYTSGDLHVGHWFNYAPADAAVRYLRMRGKNVVFPIGFDSFGLPAENAAINEGAHPKPLDRRQHRADAQTASLHRRLLRLVPRDRHLRPPSTTNGPSGGSSSSSSTTSPTASSRPPTGAPAARPCWPMSR